MRNLTYVVTFQHKPPLFVVIINTFTITYAFRVNKANGI